MPNAPIQPGRLATLALLWLIGVYMRLVLNIALLPLAWRTGTGLTHTDLAADAG